jgi:hypothetical protein
MAETPVLWSLAIPELAKKRDSIFQPRKERGSSLIFPAAEFGTF